MPPKLIVAIDQGSSSTRCIAYDQALRPLRTATRAVSTSRPAPGIVEHAADEVRDRVLAALREVAGDDGEDVAGVGIATQTESFVLWERDTGSAVTPIVSWQDQRAEELCAILARRPGALGVRRATGLELAPTFAAPKLAWLLAEDAQLRKRAEAGELAFGDVASWLAWHVSGGAAHVTEPSNACRSLLVSLEALRWEDDLLELFDVPRALLPEIRPSDHPGVRTSASVVGFDAPVAAMLGDQPAALYGQGGRKEGTAALTLGTGAFLWLNVGATPPEPPAGVLATAAWQRQASGATYALEAFCPNAGNVLELLSSLGVPDARAARVPKWSGELPVVVPALAGLGTPRWHAADRITVLEATSATTSYDLAAATVAGVAHQIADALAAFAFAYAPEVLRVGGGLSAHEGLVQAVSDLSGLTLEISTEVEVTARGVAALAAEAVGLIEHGAAPPPSARKVAPRIGERDRTRERARWERALEVHVQPAS